MLSRILVGMDDSEMAQRALEEDLEAAAEERAEVVFDRARERPVALSRGLESAAMSL